MVSFGFAAAWAFRCLFLASGGFELVELAVGGFADEFGESVA
jgi:hypothetical protein